MKGIASKFIQQGKKELFITMSIIYQDTFIYL